MAPHSAVMETSCFSYLPFIYVYMVLTWSHLFHLYHDRAAGCNNLHTCCLFHWCLEMLSSFLLFWLMVKSALVHEKAAHKGDVSWRTTVRHIHLTKCTHRYFSVLRHWTLAVHFRASGLKNSCFEADRWNKWCNAEEIMAMLSAHIHRKIETQKCMKLNINSITGYLVYVS